MTKIKKTFTISVCITYSKWTIETIEQGLKCLKLTIKTPE